MWAADNRAQLRRGARARGYRRGRRGGGRAGRPDSQASPRPSLARPPARPKSLLLSNGVRCQVEQTEGVRGGVKGRADPRPRRRRALGADSRAGGRAARRARSLHPPPPLHSSQDGKGEEGEGRSRQPFSLPVQNTLSHAHGHGHTHARAYTHGRAPRHTRTRAAGRVHGRGSRAAAEEAPRRRFVSGPQGGPALARTPPRPRPAPHPSGQLSAARAPGYSPSTVFRSRTRGGGRRKAKARGRTDREERLHACGHGAALLTLAALGPRRLRPPPPPSQPTAALFPFSPQAGALSELSQAPGGAFLLRHLLLLLLLQRQFHLPLDAASVPPLRACSPACGSAPRSRQRPQVPGR